MIARTGPRVRLAVLALALAACALVVTTSVEPSADGVRDRIDDAGVAAPLVFVAVSAGLTVVLFPGPLLAGASGLLFGTALGTPLSITAATLGAGLAFSLSRWWAHDAVERVAGPRIRVLRRWVGERGFLSVLYARIAPGVPYTLVNYAAGLAPIGLGTFAAATALGVAPRAFAYTALGGSLDDLRSPEAIVAVAVLVVMALAGALLARREVRGRRVRAAGPGRGSSSPASRTAARP